MAATSQNKDKFEDYDGFVEKFKPKKTTDDCYTPQNVYDCILQWVRERIDPLEGRTIVRPFYPGGDYEKYDYPDNCVVLDNPPFSIVTKICKFYNARGIKYFLFAPALTQFTSPNNNETYIVAHCEITYENGAVVRTGFRTNLLNGNPKIMIAGDLFQRVKSAHSIPTNSRKTKNYPNHLITSALLGRLVVRGICLDIPAQDCHFIRKLDNAPGALFGGGFLLSERAATERAAAERAATERVMLSERELEIIKSLGNGYR